MKRKGQSSLEFVLLVTFALLGMAVFLVIAQNNLAEAQNEKSKELIERVMNVVNAELLFAEQSPEGYKRTFFLPHDLDGVPYTINATHDGSGRQDIVIYFRDETYIFLLPTNSTRISNPEKLSTGTNTIYKQCGMFGCNLLLE